jgi:hypothetical protein
MRTKLASALVVMGLLASSMAPANAILGLSQCEKVKKDMLSLEKQILDVHDKGLGYTYEQVYFKEKQKIWEPTAKTAKMFRQVIANDPIPKIWKLATNNPKCFTNTQNMQIKKLENFTYKNYFDYPVNETKFKNTGECRTLLENNEYSYDSVYLPDRKTKNIISKCSLGDIETIRMKILYTSIYES